MKCFAAVLLLALFAVASADEAADVEKIEPAKAEAQVEPEAPRDRRSAVVAAYTAPVAYTAYAAPIAYSASYSVPYAYRTYPYVYSSPYIYG